MNREWLEHPGETVVQGSVSYSIIILDDGEEIDGLVGRIRDLIGSLTLWNIQSGPEENCARVNQLQYIWQCEPMEVQQRCSVDENTSCSHASSSCKGKRTALEGCVKFGENLDDEWFVVWILREISKHFPVLIRVWDNDGEFLLIEAAYSLPDWLEPDVAENRVWLLNGKVHCIPLDSRNERKRIDIDEAIGILLKDTERSRECGKDIDAVISRRIQAYPKYAQDTMHRATVCIPQSVASILIQSPQSISKSAERFSVSTPAERRHAAKVCRYLTKGEGLVPYIATFNRHTYCNLKLSSYKAPDQSPWHAYSEEYKQQSESENKDDVDVALDLGLKIALGFEMADVAPGTIENLKDYLAKDCAYKDDETWLYESSEMLESQLDIREEELGGFNPEEFSRRMKGFFNTMSNVDGAVAEEEEISLDPDLFFKILRGEPESSDEGSSFYDMDGGSVSDEEFQERERVILTETDSDDDDGFDEAYDEALAKELQNTCLGSSFARDDDAPVNLDLNLVSNLLSSYQEQDSGAGPVSNVAGLLGVSLPRHQATPQQFTTKDGTR